MMNHSTSLELSPAEIKNKDFKKTMLGYSPEEVVGFLDQVARLWEKIQKKERELLSQIEKLNSDLRKWESRQSEFAKMQEMAEAEATRIISSAQQEARKIFQEAEIRSQEVRRNTESWLTEVLEEVQEVEKQKTNFITAFQSALDSHYEILKKEQSGTNSLGHKLHEYLKNPKTAVGKEVTFPS